MAFIYANRVFFYYNDIASLKEKKIANSSSSYFGLYWAQYNHSYFSCEKLKLKLSLLYKYADIYY